MADLRGQNPPLAPRFGGITKIVGALIVAIGLAGGATALYQHWQGQAPSAVPDNRHLGRTVADTSLGAIMTLYCVDARALLEMDVANGNEASPYPR